MQRIILGLKKNGDFKIPKFSECVVDYFTNESSNFVKVSYKLEDNVLTLTADENGYKLQHSPECPIRILSQTEINDERDDIQPEKKNYNIPIAVSVIIESSDQQVLLTKRPSHMRSSPRVWVTPGGHLELGESLYEGGVREVEEETGLNIRHSKANILCFWENVYPLMLGFGPPSNHVVIAYFHVVLNETCKELGNSIKLDPKEVDSFCWLSPKTISDLFNNGHTDTVQQQYVLDNGNIVEKQLNPNEMFNMHLWKKKQSYSGVHFALRNWLEKCQFKKLWPSKF